MAIKVTPTTRNHPPLNTAVSENLRQKLVDVWAHTYLSFPVGGVFACADGKKAGFLHIQSDDRVLTSTTIQRTFCNQLALEIAKDENCCGLKTCFETVLQQLTTIRWRNILKKPSILDLQQRVDAEMPSLYEYEKYSQSKIFTHSMSPLVKEK